MLAQIFAQIGQPTAPIRFIDSVARTPLSRVVLFIAACTLLRLALSAFFDHEGKQSTDEESAPFGQVLASGISALLDAVVYAGAVVFLIVRPFLMQTFYIPSGSMLDTLQLNDYIIANKMIYRFRDPQPGEIVVFKPPKAARQEGMPPANDFIKRCIGVPGDLIEIKDGLLYRNGKRVFEPYLLEPKMDSDFKLVHYRNRFWPVSITGEYVNANTRFTALEYFPTSAEEADRIRELPPEKIPPGYFLMLGDNRNNSFDGRAWGLVPRESIIGRSEVIWLPFGRIRLTH